MLCFSPLSRLVNTTVASLMAAPLLSVTVPVIVPYTFWPNTALGVTAKTVTTANKISASFPRFDIYFFLPQEVLKTWATVAARTHLSGGDTFSLGHGANNK